MKHSLLSICLLALAATSHAQVKTGQNTATIDAAAVLELEHPNKALFLTRVALTSTTDLTTVPGPKAGMLVYNTNASLASTVTNPAAPAGVGLYCFSGTAWIAATPSTSSTPGWQLGGNAGTTDGTSFLGTTDDVPLTLRVNNTKAGRIESNPATGNVAYGFQSQLSNAPNTTTTPVQGVFNTSVGTNSLGGNTTGIRNTALGFGAGYNAGNTFFSNSTGSNNTYVGYLAGGLGTLNYVAALGSGASATTSNSLVLGATDPGPNTSTSVRVGINVTDPTQRIDFRNGHLRNRQDILPTVVLVPGTGVTAAGMLPGSSDVRGRVNTTGLNNQTAYTTIRVGFNYTCTNAPTVTLTPANADAALTRWYVNTDVNGFTLYFQATAAMTNPAQFNYMVIE